MADFLTNLFGEKPQVAKYKKQNLGDAQTQSLLGNIGSFGDISKLGDAYLKYMTDSQNQQLPGYSDTLAMGEKGAQDILKQGTSLVNGEIPQDVIDAVQRNSAYQSLSGGFAGSGMSRGLTARDLGLTSLDLMGKGASMIGQGGNSAQQWASMAKGNMYDPNQSLVNPMQQEQANVQNEVYRQQSQQMGFNVAAAPDPQTVGLYNTGMGLLGSGVSAVSSMAGMGGGESWQHNASSGGGGGGL